MSCRWAALGVWLVLAALPAVPARGQGLVPVGEPAVQAGIRVRVGYLPWAVSLDPPRPAVEGPHVIHLQVEVEAVRGNPYGLDPDDDVPYLRIPFVLVHEPTGRRQEGVLEPMVSRDGFHYGANVALIGPGPQSLTLEVGPPEGLARHTDPRTERRSWWAAFTLTWRFRYTPGE
ncbi:MAG TPA: iron transporter [Methylomirabilota bacterium]|nr:iron transporter [Methylomirabilota bacterium]